MICTQYNWNRSGIELQTTSAEAAYLEVRYIQHYALAASGVDYVAYDLLEHIVAVSMS